METDEKYFSFVVKTEFDTKVRYDQSGVVMYLDSENWLKASMEYENENIQRDQTERAGGIMPTCPLLIFFIIIRLRIRPIRCPQLWCRFPLFLFREPIE